MISHKRCFVFFTLFLSFLVLSCSKGTLESTHTLRISNGSEPESIDPALCQSFQCFRVVSALFDGLVLRGDSSQPILPGIAHTWTISEDGLTYTFLLRKSTWSDNTPLVAQDFVWSWKRLVAPNTAASYRSLLDAVRNADQIATGKMPAESLAVFAPNDSTFVVKLKQPQAYFLNLVTLEPLFPTPRHIIQNTDGTLNNNWTSENLVSNGAFKVQTWLPHNQLTLVKNSAYWEHEKGFPKLDTLQFFPTENNQTELSMFMAKQVDWVHKLAPTRIVLWKNKPEFISRAKYGLEMYRFNTTHPLLKNKALRYALSISIDRDKIVQYVSKGGEKPAWGFLPDGVAGYNAHTWFKFDPSLARSILKQQNIDPKIMPPLEIIYNQSGNNKVMAEVVADMWRKELGLKVNLRNLEWKVLLDHLEKLDYSVARSSWIGDYLDPTTFTDLFESTSPNNRTGYKSKTYDSLAYLIRSQSLERFRQTELLDSIISTDAPVIPLYSYRNIELRNTRIQGVMEHPLGLYSYKHIWLRPSLPKTR